MPKESCGNECQENIRLTRLFNSLPQPLGYANLMYFNAAGEAQDEAVIDYVKSRADVIEYAVYKIPDRSNPNALRFSAAFVLRHPITEVRWRNIALQALSQAGLRNIAQTRVKVGEVDIPKVAKYFARRNSYPA